MKFIKETFIEALPERVFGFHLLPDAIDRLIPPGENVRVVERADVSQVGSRAVIEQTFLGVFKSRWVAEHTVYDPPHLFEDVQISGPFKTWRHRHLFLPHKNGTILRDEIEYEMPIPIFGPLAAPLAIEPKLEKMFDHRHRVTKEWCESEKN